MTTAQTKPTGACLAFFLLLCCSATARAQPPSASFTDLQNRLRVGDTVLVTDEAGQTTKGTVEQVTDARMFVRGKEREKQFSAQTAQQVVRLRHPVLKDSLIGLADGVGAFFLGYAWVWEVTGGHPPPGAVGICVQYGLVGTAVGNLVGSIRYERRVVFERPSTGRPQAAVAPLLRRDGAGILVHVSF